jgi:nucleoside 2-deoxyribosyltransferase
MKKVAVYLAGPIFGQSDEGCNGWRELLKLAAPDRMYFLDPMDRDYRGQERTYWRDIVEGDKRDILNCDCVVANATKPSVGTSMEIYHSFLFRIPIVVLVEDGPVSPWLRYHASKVCVWGGDAPRVISEVKDLVGK